MGYVRVDVSVRRFHSYVPGVDAVHLAYLSAAQQQQQQRGAAEAGEPACSPLLVLRDNRQYSIAAPPGGLGRPGRGWSLGCPPPCA